MSKKRKSKELKDKEDDLLFYLGYWNKFPSTCFPQNFVLKKSSV